MKNPLVSIIIPVYNVEKYIERCARSLFNQDLDNIEFIFIDDCSPDHSIEILHHLIEEYHSKIEKKHWIVKTERMPCNCGQAVVRKNAVQLATGDYVIFCDSDDWVESDMMSKMWNLAQTKNLDAVVCDYDHVRASEIVKHKGMNARNATDFLDEVSSIFASWSLWNKLFKRSLYTDNRIMFPNRGMNVGEDMAIVLQLLYYCRDIGYIEESFYHYIDNEDSISNRKSISGVIDNYIQWISNVCLLESFFKNKKIYGKMTKRLSYIIVFATDEVLARLDFNGIRTHFLIMALCFKTWMSTTISLYGKMSVWRYVRRMYCNSLVNKIHLVRKL